MNEVQSIRAEVEAIRARVNLVVEANELRSEVAAIHDALTQIQAQAQQSACSQAQASKDAEAKARAAAEAQAKAKAEAEAQAKAKAQAQAKAKAEAEAKAKAEAEAKVKAQAASASSAASAPVAASASSSSSAAAPLSGGGGSIADAWHDLQDRHTPTNWILTGFQERKNELELIGTGTQGIRELKSHLCADRVLFAALQVFAVDDRSSESGRRDKFLFLTFIGSKVSVMKKARVSVQRNQVLKNFPGVQISFDVGDPDDLDLQALARKLMNSCGAHKPTFFAFGPSDEDFVRV